MRKTVSPQIESVLEFQQIGDSSKDCGEYAGALMRKFNLGLYKQVYACDPLLQPNSITPIPAVRVDQLDCLVSNRSSGLICFDDHWTLLAWSRYLHKFPERCGNSMVILHADDHTDLGSPLICATGDTMYRITDGMPFVVNDPKSVIDAIRADAIEIGTFIVPLCHFARNLQIQHLSLSSDVDLEEKLLPYYTRNVAWEKCNRLAVSKNATSGKDRVVPYHRTSNIDTWLKGVPSATDVLLHIDADVFNNRYRGGMTLPKGSVPYNPPLSAIQERVFEFKHKLLASHVVGQIRCISLALSPGFFPSEYWRTMLEMLEPLFLAVGEN